MRNKICIIIIFILFIFGCSKQDLQEYTKELDYFDSTIYIKLYTTKDKANKTFEYIENIINEYENIINRDNINSEVSYIYNNTSINKKIKISKYMNDLIEYGIKLYNDSNTYLSINTGDIVDLWNNNIVLNNELNNIDTNIDKIIVKNNVLDNNHVNLYFDQFIKGYLNNLIKNYLENMNIDYYFINTESEILTGKNINDKDYIVAISSPFNDEILKVFNIQNKYIVTKSIYHNSYEYNGELYSSIVDAKNKTMANNMISVTVVSDDIYIGEMVANMLFMNDYDIGTRIANKYNIKAIWCFKENGKNIIKSNMEEI